MSSDEPEPMKFLDRPYQDLEDVSNIMPLRAKNRTQTYLDTPAQSAIDEFVSVTYSIEHYKALAKRAQKLLERALKGARDSDKIELQFRITCRAKEIKSLKEKLKTREKKRKYRTVRDILEDVPDLAGVRVVLYTPNKAQRSKVREVIREIWPEDVEERFHGDPLSSHKAKLSRIDNDSDNDSDSGGQDDADSGVDSETYVPKHLGYQADHYRAYMRQDQGDDSYGYKVLDRVEIQVVSALGHVWAEAGHDVMYKTHAYGNPTKLEHRILDALSGLITSGDLLLEEFRESVTRRTYARWKYPEELSMWLRESDVMKKSRKRINQSLDTSHFGTAGINVLYRFLSKTDKNYPIAVRNVLKELKFPKDPMYGLEKEVARFGSGFEPPKDLLVLFCIISHLMPAPEGSLQIKEHDVSQKCGVMMDALILLQTFAGTADVAKTYLRTEVVDHLTGDEKESIDFVLNHPLRYNCFSHAGDSGTDLAQDLQAAWDWFVRQAVGDRLCGFFFRLAVMGVAAEDMNPLERLEKLRIESL